jgi:hypothetical protein
MNKCDACINPNSVYDHQCDELGPWMLVGSYSDWDYRSGGDVPIAIKIKPEQLTVPVLIELLRGLSLPDRLLGKACKNIEKLLEHKSFKATVGDNYNGSSIDVKLLNQSQYQAHLDRLNFENQKKEELQEQYRQAAIKKEARRKELVESALSKLTPEEIKAIGIIFT